MEVLVEKITEETLELKEQIPAASWDMDSSDVKFSDEIKIICRFKAVYREILVEADITTYRDIICSRCLKNARQESEHKFRKSYDKNKLGQYLDVDPDIREEILLNFPMKSLCRQDCKGLCPGCGADLNINKCSCKSKENSQ